MIGNALAYIRKRLDAHLRAAQGEHSDGDTPDRVVFLEGDKPDPLTFPQSCIAMVVVNVQEDREFRDADRFQRRLPYNNSVQLEPHYPDIHLDLAVLFVASFKDYATAWNQLSETLFFFQQHPVFERSPDMDWPKSLERLSNELRTQSIQDQNEVWSALRASLRPALLYRFRLITLHGKALTGAEPPHEIQFKVNDNEKVRFKVIDKDVKAKLAKEKDKAINLRSPPIS